MSLSFDLTQEGWIPCLMFDGSTDELSLADALIGAHTVREVVDPSPLVTVSLHRLMLAILHRVFGPRDTDEWAALWERGRFDEEMIHGYLTQWQHRFDLFDKARPFYQTAGMSEDMLKSVGNLAPELASGNNDTLFDHSMDDKPVAITAGRAASWLIAVHAYAIGGLIGTEGGRASTTSAPMVAGAAVMPTGSNLFESLMLNLIPYDPDNDQPMPCEGDAPAWEQPDPAAVQQRLPFGYLDYLTWQSRRIWLKPSVTEGISPGVSHIIISQAREFPRGYFPRDPVMVHVRREKAPKGQDPWPAIRLREHRGVWRDSSALFQTIPDVHCRPAVLDTLAGHVLDGIIPPERAYTVSVCGLCSDKAKVHFWRHERMPVPLKYLTDEYLVAALNRALTVAEDVGSALRRALWALASIIAAPDDDKDADRETIASLSDGFSAREVYWADLEMHFAQLLHDLASHQGEDTRHAVLCWWAEEVAARTAFRAFDCTVAGLPATYRFLKASVRARNSLTGRIYGDCIAQYRREVNHAGTK